MHPVTISIPTKIIFGVESYLRIPEEVRGLGGDAVFSVTDKGVAQTGFFKKVIDLLQSSKIGIDIFDEVEPDPTDKTVEKAFNLYQKGKVSVLLALGGGSPMDTAKAVGILATNGGRIHDYEAIDRYKSPSLPLIAVPTTAGTGSEVSGTTVITDTERGLKISIRHPRFNPARVAILDPLALTSLPASVAAHAGMDAFIHALESFVSLQSSPIIGGITLHAIRLIGESIRPFVANRGNLEAGGNMLSGAAMGAMGFTNTGAGNVHCMARLVGTFFHVPHGLANAVCLPSVAEFNMIACPEKFARVAQAMGVQIDGMTSLEAARSAVSAIKVLCEDIGIPRNLKEIGGKEEAIPKMAQLAFQSNYNRWNPRYTTEEDFVKLFCRAMG
jgi:alcohol dehydrogenase